MDNKSFDSRRIAEGYAKRPWLHKQVIEQFRKDYNIHTMKNGLDVGCGAGLSTKALRMICEKVTGTDISPEMINVCKQLYNDEAYDFYVAKAENTVMPMKKYDIVTAAGVINWVNREEFFKNASSVMTDDGIMIIYDFAVTDCMSGIPEYTAWYQNQYMKKFPKPPRNEHVWTQEDLCYGLLMERQIKYNLQYMFALEDFVDFMMLQSNVNVKIESGELTEKEIRAWMRNTLSAFFHDQKQTIIFSGYSWYIKK